MRHVQRLGLVCALGCAAALADMSGAMADEPVDLTRLRREYEKRADVVLRPLRQQYRTSLQQLQKRLTARGDLEAAVTVKQEIESLPEQGPALTLSLTILKATFGTSKKRSVDVTATVQKLVRENRLLFNEKKDDGELMNATFGNPHPGSIKTLTINYKFGGRTRTVKFKQSEAISLP